MSDIFIRYLLSFVVLFVVVKWRAWPAAPAKLRAPKVLCPVGRARCPQRAGVRRPTGREPARFSLALPALRGALGQRALPYVFE